MKGRVGSRHVGSLSSRASLDRGESGLADREARSHVCRLNKLIRELKRDNPNLSTHDAKACLRKRVVIRSAGTERILRPFENGELRGIIRDRRFWLIQRDAVVASFPKSLSKTKCDKLGDFVLVAESWTQGSDGTVIRLYAQNLDGSFDPTVMVCKTLTTLIVCVLSRDGLLVKAKTVPLPPTYKEAAATVAAQVTRMRWNARAVAQGVST